MAELTTQERLEKLEELKKLREQTGISQPPQPQDQQGAVVSGIVSEIDKVLMRIPGVPQLAEVASGFNRSITGALDMIGPDGINAILEIGGSDARIPTFSSATQEKGTFVGKGLEAEILGGMGEVGAAGLGMGALIRGGAQQLSRLTQASENTVRGILRQMGQTTATQDVAFGALAGAGGAVGEDVLPGSGELIGSIFAPLAGGGIQQGLRKLLSSGGQGVSVLAANLSKMSEEGAASLLAEAMVREGLSPEDVTGILAKLGPEAIPADVSINFARLLRAASNKIPRIEGRAAQVFQARQAGQTDRLASALDSSAGVPGLSVDDEIQRLNIAWKPVITQLYEAAGSKPLKMSRRLRALLTGDNSVSRARKKSQSRLADKRAAGDKITNIDMIDATKQELDDQIGTALRAGEKNRVRDLVRLKNIMIEEVDVAIPEYAQARNLFAGKAQLESAAEAGELFFKLKPREIETFIQSYGASERRMFRLGAKQAILDRVDNLQMNADAVKRLFGRRGDVRKLQALFDDEAAFSEFSSVLEREANFVLTRRAAQANSTTAQQLADIGSASTALENARALTGDPLAAASGFGRILSGFASKKGSDSFVQALEQAGDILLSSGTDPKILQALLRRGDSARIKVLLENVLIQPSKVALPSIQALAASQIAPEQ